MKVVISGIPAFDGTYVVDDVAPWTNRELNIIKRLSGVRAGELEEAMRAGDNDVIVAIAVIAIRQSGKNWQAFEEVIYEAPAGSIAIPQDEVEAVPPQIPSPPEPSENEDEQQPPSGLPSSDDGDDHQETSLPATGSLHLATGAA